MGCVKTIRRESISGEGDVDEASGITSCSEVAYIPHYQELRRKIQYYRWMISLHHSWVKC